MDVDEFYDLVLDYHDVKELILKYDDFAHMSMQGIPAKPVESRFGNRSETILKRIDLFDTILDVLCTCDNLHEHLDALQMLETTDHVYEWVDYERVLSAAKHNPDEQAQAVLTLAGFYDRYEEALMHCSILDAQL